MNKLTDEKLRRVDTNPEFDVIYGYLSNFLTPFIEAKSTVLVWDNTEGSWKS